MADPYFCGRSLLFVVADPYSVVADPYFMADPYSGVRICHKVKMADPYSCGRSLLFPNSGGISPINIFLCRCQVSLMHFYVHQKVQLLLALWH